MQQCVHHDTAVVSMADVGTADGGRLRERRGVGTAYLLDEGFQATCPFSPVVGRQAVLTNGAFCSSAGYDSVLMIGSLLVQIPWRAEWCPSWGFAHLLSHPYFYVMLYKSIC